MSLYQNYLQSKNDSLSRSSNDPKEPLNQPLKAKLGPEEAKYGLVDSRETQELLAEKLLEVEEYRSEGVSMGSGEKRNLKNR